MTDLHLYTKLSALPEHLKQEVFNFIEALNDKSQKEHSPSERPAGLAKGMIKISEDFDEPLEDFENYM